MDKEQIGKYTIARTEEGFELTSGFLTFFLTVEEAWKFFDYFHNHHDEIYHALRRQGKAYQCADTAVVYEPCCDYILYGLRQRDEIVEQPPNEQGYTYESAVREYRQIRMIMEQEQIEKERRA